MICAIFCFNSLAIIFTTFAIEIAASFSKQWLGWFEQHFPKDKWAPSRWDAHGSA